MVMISVVVGTAVPRLPSGSRLLPSGRWASTAMYPAARIMLIGATGNQPSQ